MTFCGTIQIKHRRSLLVLSDRGRLKVTSHPAGGYKPLLPLNLDDKHCRGDNRTVRCFKAGKKSIVLQIIQRILTGFIFGRKTEI